MNYLVKINVMPLKELLDPQGKAVLGGLSSLGIQVEDVRIGKQILLHINATSAADAKALATEAAKKLLANPVMEEFEITVEEGK